MNFWFRGKVEVWGEWNMWVQCAKPFCRPFITGLTHNDFQAINHEMINYFLLLQRAKAVKIECSEPITHAERHMQLLRSEVRCLWNVS